MDQEPLLSTERLRLSRELQRGWASRGAVVIKNVPTQTYLAVSTEQAQVLESFKEGATVPEVFTGLLQERRCPPLREFYELVLKALQVGVLSVGSSRRPLRPALNWPGWRPGAGWLWPLAVLNLAVVLGLAWRVELLAAQWTPGDIFVGVALAAAALSAGQALAAMVVAGAGGEVYGRRALDSLRLLHLRLDLRDSRLLRPAEQAWVALARTLPLALVLLLALGFLPGAVPPLAAAWLLLWRPWGKGVPRELGALLGRYPPLDTDSNFIFHLNQRPQLHWRPWWRRWDWRVCALELVVAVAWTALVGRFGLGLAGIDVGELVRARPDYWLLVALGLAAALLLTIMGRICFRWRAGWREMRRNLWRRWDLVRRRRGPFEFPETEAALQRIAAEHPLLGLLGLLNPYDRAEIVRAWRPVTFRPREVLEVVTSEGDSVGLILSGRATGTRLTSAGRRMRVLGLEEGDFFGQAAGDLFGGTEARFECRAVTPVAALVLPAGLFRRCVVEQLGAGLVQDLTYKLAFLRRLPVCAHWDVASVARFARLTQIVAYADGESLVREGQEPRWFYIVFDGTAQVRRGGELVSLLKAGDFFGEISLLQNSAAMADVVAQGSLRCLQVDRKDFLRFVARDYRAALALERISSARLGRPIFPLRSAPIGTSHPFRESVRREACYS